MDLSTISTIVQCSIITLVAALLHELTRVKNMKFLIVWSRAWVALAIALAALLISFNRSSGVNVILQMVYCVGEYIFGYLIWMGCRNYHTGQQFRRVDYANLVGLVILGISLPLVFPGLQGFFPVHAGILSCLFMFAAIECRSPAHELRLVGIRVLRLSLSCLAILFAHYALFLGWFCHRFPQLKIIPMEYSSLYDATLEIGVAFGMILLATERVRQELEEKNRRLEETTVALKKSSLTDPLTGLLNRLAFEQLQNQPEPLGSFGSVAMIDLNNLKPLNDHYGHKAGDVALQLVARTLKFHSRVTDPIYRMGGDEFLIVMPECSVPDMTDRMAMIDIALKHHRIPGADSPVDLEIAWGITEYATPAEYRSAVMKADEQMYAQKKERKGDVRSREKVLV